MDSGSTVKGFLSLLKSPFLRVGKTSIEEIRKLASGNLGLCERAHDRATVSRGAGADA